MFDSLEIFLINWVASETCSYFFFFFRWIKIESKWGHGKADSLMRFYGSRPSCPLWNDESVVLQRGESAGFTRSRPVAYPTFFLSFINTIQFVGRVLFAWNSCFRNHFCLNSRLSLHSYTKALLYGITRCPSRWSIARVNLFIATLSIVSGDPSTMWTLHIL